MNRYTFVLLNLLLVFMSRAAAIASPANMNFGLLGPSNGHHCAVGPPNTRPKFYACHQAIELLPSNHAEGNFHASGIDDGFRLPYARSVYHSTVSNCEAMVELVSGFDSEAYSWVGIRLAGSQLATLCSDEKVGNRRTGGWITVGPRDAIRLSLGEAVPPHNGIVLNGGLNATVATVA